MAADASKDVVYLEDIQTDRSKKRKTADTEEEVPKTTNKRQVTLTSMFTSGAAAGNNAVKKGKSSVTGTTVTATNAPSTVVAKKAGLQRLNSIPFSLSAYVEGLTDEQKRLLALECEVMGKSWLKVLKDEFTKPYFLKLKRFLWEEGVHGPDDSAKNLKIFPAPKNIYAWSNTPLGKVKVVIIGQDPYHGAGQAHGLCFSVPQGIAVPPSLKNIYAEIKAEYPEFTPPKHGNLTAWANNGVLMLNTSLTVRAGQAGSHQGKGWEEFTDRVVDVVDKYGGANLPASSATNAGYGRGLVWLAWGAWAGKRVSKLDKKKHLILQSPHPSPLSAHRGFLGNGHFKKANDWLFAKYGADGMVDWCNLDAQAVKEIEADDNKNDEAPVSTVSQPTPSTSTSG